MAKDKKQENLELELAKPSKDEKKEEKKKEKAKKDAKDKTKPKKEKEKEPGVMYITNPSKTIKGRVVIWTLLFAMALSFIAAFISIILKANGVI